MTGASNEQIDLANPFIPPLSVCPAPNIRFTGVHCTNTARERIHTDTRSLWGHKFKLWHVVIFVSRMMLHELLYWIFSNYKNFFQFLVGEDLSVENRPIHLIFHNLNQCKSTFNHFRTTSDPAWAWVLDLSFVFYFEFGPRRVCALLSMVFIQ